MTDNQLSWCVGALMLVIIALVVAAFWVWYKWFPGTTDTRIKRKKKGELTYFRPEVKRPIFGWTPIWVSEFTGEIMRDGGWVSRHCDAAMHIYIFNKLKPIKK